MAHSNPTLSMNKKHTFLHFSLFFATSFIASGCTYHLRTAPTLPFSSLEVPTQAIPLETLVPSGTGWTEILKRELGLPEDTPPSTINTTQKWRLQLVSDTRQRQIASLASDGTVREYRLYRWIKVQLVPPMPLDQHQKETLSTTFLPINLEVFRDLPYLESQRTAKELEENKLWQDMEQEIGQRIANQIIWQTENHRHTLENTYKQNK